MGKIDASQIKERKPAAQETLSETVGKSFFIDLSIGPASQAPGPVWLDQYDLSYLRVVQAGYVNTYEGNQSFFVEFLPIKAGQTQVLFIQQPRLINPLFIDRPYAITISQ